MCSLLQPLVSVVIPAYDAERFLGSTLESVCAQSYTNLEVWVVDDGSSDRTAEIVETFAARDPRIALLRQANAGVAAARNLGIQNARGEFIAPLDADDLWRSEAIAMLVARFQGSGPEVGVVYAWSADVDECGRGTGGFHAATVEGNVYRSLLCHNFLGNASSSLIRKTCLDRLGGYRTQFHSQDAQGCEDWDLYLRLAACYEFRAVPEFLVGYRRAAGGMSGDFHRMARSHALMLQSLWEQHRAAAPKFLHGISRSSFYLFFAHQCNECGDARSTLHWLQQALAADPITPLGRLGFYTLLLKNSVRRLQERLWPPASRPTVAVAGSPTRDRTTVMFPTERGAAFPRGVGFGVLKVWLKVLAGQILYRSLEMLPDAKPERARPTRLPPRPAALGNLKNGE